MAKKKYICAGCNKCTEPCTVELSGDADMTKDPAKMLHCGTWVEVPAEENTNKEQLPKLTTEVFSMEECPEWARYAAVDAEGVAYWYATKPKLDPQAWCNVSENFHARQITLANMPIRYDKTNWRNSLIERPVKEQRPKLTVDVFSMSECPEWAEYAAVDADGNAYWYDGKPRPLGAAWYQGGGYRASQIGQRYDASDWKNSLIERLVRNQLPKLTFNVFATNECPEWAQYAAVDSDGVAYWYADKPELNRGLGGWNNTGEHIVQRLTLYYDSTDWEHSAVYRAGTQQGAELGLLALTHDVFSYSTLNEWKYVMSNYVERGRTYTGCPDWARYAAVNEDGAVYVYEFAPVTLYKAWADSCGRYAIVCDADKHELKFDATNWRGSLIERQPAAPRQKLTIDVFSMEACPMWAKYAAVDANGVAWYYERKPRIEGSRWDTPAHLEVRAIYDSGKYAKFDASDWEHSLIERPAVVPDWFKPGVLAYNNDTHTCFHVTDSTEYCESYLEAKVRPFSDDELERKLGQCVLGPKNSRLLVTGFRPKGDISGKSEICVLCGWLTAEELLTYGSRPQGINQYHSKEGAWIDCGLSN